MNRKTGLICVGILLAIFCSGCWSYRGINETTIISGIAIDKDGASDEYHITYEVVDLTEDIKQIGVRSKIVESEGKTIFDAVRNAKKRLVSRLFFGNTQIVVVSQQVAEEGLFQVIDWFLRDAESRETVHIVVSQQETAKEMFRTVGIDNMIIAYEMNEILETDGELSASTLGTRLYNVFNALKREGTSSFVLPAFRAVPNNKELTAEVNGVAFFKGDKMLGFLTPDETKYLLFTINKVYGGLLTVSSQNGEMEDTALEISTNTTKRSYSYQGGNLKVIIQIKAEVYLGEIQRKADMLNEQEILKLESAAENKIEQEITALVRKMQSEYGLDIFGFGGMIYEKEPELWQSIKPGWDELFKTIDIQVQCDVKISNTAIIMRN